eukprot:GEMP01051334.1.p1 GENE.GEMP01051334.1~~GEMP01051334.1.p1  ORF type:complete len:152 (+),score=33.61 GEMP01051334.1:495-950(+)
MEHLQNNVGRNFEKGPTVLPLNWFENPAYTRTRFPAVDLVVAADIIYFPHLFKPLLTTMFALCRRPTTEVLVANMTKFPKFVPNLDRFLRMAHKMGFTVEKMCDKTMNGPPSAYSHMLNDDCVPGALCCIWSFRHPHAGASDLSSRACCFG